MSSKDFGLGPKWWQKPGNKLKKCSERKTNWCDPTETDGCCAIIPCMYCLQLEIYGQSKQFGDTEFETSAWSGTVGGGSFLAFWEVGYDSGICEFVVHWNGEEVYRKSCADGQSCRDSSDEVAVVVDYEDATLRWIKHEYRPMPYVKDPNTNCTVHFCGDCECTCEELCYTISNLALDSASGTMPQLSYSECEGPTWGATFTLGEEEYTIFAELVKDPETGDCILQVQLNGDSVDPIVIDDCREISGSWILYDGGSFAISCKKCGCNPRTGCCPNLPETLYATVDLTATTTPMPGICPTIRIYGTIRMDLSVDGSAAIWQSVSSPLTGDSCGEIANPPPEFYAVVSCGPTGMSLSIGTNESATAGVIWQAFYEGCNGGILSACDPNVSQAFGGRSACDNWGALSV